MCITPLWHTFTFKYHTIHVVTTPSRKYITSAVANIIYKQAIVSLYNYADFIIESGPKVYIDRLNKLHEKALRIIDCNTNRKLSHEKLETLFGLWSPATRRHKHHCALMYRLSKRGDFLDTYRPKIHLRVGER